MKEQNSPEEVLYAVFRSGIRVSESVYSHKKDPLAEIEKSYWEMILYRFPDGTKIEILPVRYKHRN